MSTRYIAATTLLLFCLAASFQTPSAEPVTGSYLEHPAFPDFARRMKSRHGFGDAEMKQLFADVTRQQSIIDAISRPAETKPWHEYRKIFMTEERIKGGADFWKLHKETLDQAATTFNVDPEMIVAIIGVETFYGRITGNYPVITALATLGFDYAPRRRFFLGELEQFLVLTREESFDPKNILGSYAGAMGASQFIASSYRQYAVDFDFDNQRNLWQSWPDIIGSVANYFKQAGWKKGGLIAIPAVGKEKENQSGIVRKGKTAEFRAAGFVFSEGIADERDVMLISLEQPEEYEYWVAMHNYSVIMKYNRSPLYAMAAYQLSQAILNARADHAR
ncbi:MAG: lytic murein transglycosylase B [Gammaproteobacteria bacterium]